MFKYTAKVMILVCTLLFGLLLGIHQAERGIFSVEGTSHSKEQESFNVKKVDEEHVEVAVLGESFSTKDLEEKKEKWKERHHHNTFSHLGNQLGEMVYAISRKGAKWFVEQVDKIL